ncbi:hypothetical protein KVT40_001156 [Elsinoe batatas]|uniref:Uncharacterized protein n=1 Tax=Elsinoe batatas TaxID=2601811 RepID=A0A8K0LCK8_9PEZI|nr:hypothetical protein KVT40_001156 [Elsinoe batatas]
MQAPHSSYVQSWDSLVPHRDVFARFLRKLGLSERIGIIQRTTLRDDEDLDRDMPHPVYAVIVVLKQEISPGTAVDILDDEFRRPRPNEAIPCFQRSVGGARSMFAFFNAFVNSPLQYCCDTETSLSFFMTQSQGNREHFLRCNGGLREDYHDAIRFGIERLGRNIKAAYDFESRYLCFFKQTAFANKLWVWDSDPERLMVADVGSRESGCLKGHSLDYIRNTIGHPELFGEPLPDMILCLADEDDIIRQLEALRKREHSLRGEEADDEGEYLYPAHVKVEDPRRKGVSSRAVRGRTANGISSS